MLSAPHQWLQFRECILVHAKCAAISVKLPGQRLPMRCQSGGPVAFNGKFSRTKPLCRHSSSTSATREHECTASAAAPRHTSKGHPFQPTIPHHHHSQLTKNKIGNKTIVTNKRDLITCLISRHSRASRTLPHA